LWMPTHSFVTIPDMGSSTGIGLRIKRERIRKGFTQAELANKAGLTPGAISQFETGARDPNSESLQKLALALSVTADLLLGRKNFDEAELVSDPQVRGLFRKIGDLSEEAKQQLISFADFLVKESGKGRRERDGAKDR
jgi:transcriptional regulator with XRE-family HTH domain